ncbi:MAG: ribokinase [Caldilineaceae bacterium]|nr:ribokinase [Caldilineaceae bacterium]
MKVSFWCPILGCYNAAAGEGYPSFCSAMSILVFGSLNIDHVYKVEHLVRPGETLPSTDYRRFQGGKGANQSVALARAGAKVFHAGRIGPEGLWLRDAISAEGVDVSHVGLDNEPTGHAIIQVDPAGENSILLFGGANLTVTPDDAHYVLSQFGEGDWLLLQNEISSLPAILREASARQLTVAFNPAPMTPEVLDYPLEGVSLFVVNETEGAALAGIEKAPPASIVDRLRVRYPDAAILLTLGGEGSLFASGEERIRTPAQAVEAVDTTAAGDTFIGYFLANLVAGQPAAQAVEAATRAAALCVSRPGAAASIPRRNELD